MFNRKTIALTLAAALASASVAVAAPMRSHVLLQQPASSNGFNAYARANSQAGPFYYEPSSGGTVWSYYPGYAPTVSNSQPERY
jgi:hypothetical protein